MQGLKQRYLVAARQYQADGANEYRAGESEEQDRGIILEISLCDKSGVFIYIL
mgnify:CR=1 FL=1